MVVLISGVSSGTSTFLSATTSTVVLAAPAFSAMLGTVRVSPRCMAMPLSVQVVKPLALIEIE
jgi:hypothetical protein